MTEPSETSPSPSPSPEEAQKPAIPANCDELLPPETVQSYDSRLVQIDEGPAVQAALVELLGPVTYATLQAGESQVYCGWGIEQSGAFASLGVAAIDAEAQTDLVAALSDSVYEEAEPGSAAARFVQAGSFDHQYMDDIVIGDGLLIAVSHSIEGNFALDTFTQVTHATGPVAD